VALVAILDADKEGFLRSATSLIQTAGRAARHEKGRVILYADVITKSIQQTLDTTRARRDKQLAYNAEHGITPRGVKRGIDESLHAPGKRYDVAEAKDSLLAEADDRDIAQVIAEMEEEMLEAARKLQFEKAAMIRDQIETLQTGKHGGGASGAARSKPKKKRTSVYNNKGMPRKRGS
jgi:excinuclease ABC subunit B